MGFSLLSASPDPDLSPLGPQICSIALKVWIPADLSKTPEWRQHLALRLLNPQAGPVSFVAKVPLPLDLLEQVLLKPTFLPAEIAADPQVPMRVQLYHYLLLKILPNDLGLQLRDHSHQMLIHLQLAPPLHSMAGSLTSPDPRVFHLVRQLQLPTGWTYYSN